MNDRYHKRWLSGLLAVALITSLTLMLGCAALLEDPEADEPIIFADRQWESVWIATEIAQFIIEEGYDHPTETETVSTDAFQVGMQHGDIHVELELWRMNLPEWYEEATSEGYLIDVGSIYETSRQAWYVPRYVIEGDEERGIEPIAADLETVWDMKDYYEAFEDPDDPGRGRFINGISGWVVTEINEVKMQVYGLDEYYNTVEPGSSGALDAAIAGAIEAGDPIFFYYWEPTWLPGMYDVVVLEEPEYDPEVEEQLERAAAGEIPVEDVDEACGFIELDIRKGVHKSVKERAPEIFEFLENMFIGTDPINQTMAYKMDADASPQEAAFWYFENFEDDWREWLPDDVAQRVTDALIENGVDLSG